MNLGANIDNNHEDESDGSVEEYDHQHPQSNNSTKSPSSNVGNQQYLALLFQISSADIPIFFRLIGLCDPKTQPEETDDDVLSLDILTDVFMALIYAYHSETVTVVEQSSDEIDEASLEGFNFSTILSDSDSDQMAQEPPRITLECYRTRTANQLMRILLQILPMLGGPLNNEPERDPRDGVNAAEWSPKVPLRSDSYNVTITYMMVCVLFNTIRKLFPDEENNHNFNLAKNPFTPFFMKMFIVYFRIVHFCLQVDRFMEKVAEATPPYIFDTLKGSSLVKHVLAYILNYSYDFNPNDQICLVDPNYYDDIHNKSLLSLYSPSNRSKFDGGAFMKAIEHFSLLRFTFQMFDDTIDTYYTYLYEDQNYEDDKFVHDLRYIFESEDEDDTASQQEANGDQTELNEEEEEQIEEVMDESKMRLRARRLQKQKKDEEILNHKGYNYQKDYTLDPNERIIKHDFGDDGPIGANKVFVEEDFPQQFTDKATMNAFYSIDEFKKHILILLLYPQPVSSHDQKYRNIAEKLIRTVSGRIVSPQSFEQPFSPSEYLFSDVVNEDLVAKIVEKTSITPVFRIKYFELLLETNSEVATRLFDEMLMEPGERRINIWMLCHEINLSNRYIDYIYLLLVQSRRFEFDISRSRKGNGVLFTSQDKSMIIHEFLEGAGEFLAASEGIETDEGYQVVLFESVCLKYVLIICMMIESWIKEGVISVNSHANLHVIYQFLFNYVAKIPQARQTYFRVYELSQKAESLGSKPLNRFVDEEVNKKGTDLWKTYTPHDPQQELSHRLRHVWDLNYNLMHPSPKVKKGDTDVMKTLQLYYNAFPILSISKDFGKYMMVQIEHSPHNSPPTPDPEEEAFLNLDISEEDTYPTSEEEGDKQQAKKKRKKKKKKGKKH